MHNSALAVKRLRVERRLTEKDGAGGVDSTLHSNKSANKCTKMSMETLIVLPNNSRAIEEEMAVIRIISMKRLR